MDSAGSAALGEPRSEREDNEAELEVSDRLLELRRAGQRQVEVRRGDQAEQKGWKEFKKEKEQKKRLSAGEEMIRLNNKKRYSNTKPFEMAKVKNLNGQY